MADLRKTPLHHLHCERGAKMVEFAGWEMPLNYGSQIEEHHAVRRAAGMFDVSHMLAIDLDGGEARDFLRYLLANDAGKLARSGSALYSCMLNEAGGVLDDLIVYFLAQDRFRLVVNAGTAQADVAWIEAWRGRVAPGLEIRVRRDLAIIAVQGPAALERLWQVRPYVRDVTEPLRPFQAVAVGDMLLARTGYTGEDGCEIMLPGAAAVDLWGALERAQVTPAGLGARDTLRLEAGLNLYGQDMDGSTTPFDCGLGWTVDLGSNRQFIGRSALAAPPAWQQLGAVLLDRGVMRAHQAVRTPVGGGTITSGGFAPTLNRSIALARLPPAVKTDDLMEVEVRGRWLKAKAVKPPFVRRGRVLVSLDS